MGFRRILIAVDSSPIAARAVDVGIELAQSLGGELALVHVINPALFMAPDGGVPVGDLKTEAEAEGKRLLSGLAARARLAEPALAFLQIGAPAAEIVQAARDWQADIVVIGSHGRGGITRALVGSVAEDVMRHAQCPVLVVRTGS